MYLGWCVAILGIAKNSVPLKSCLLFVSYLPSIIAYPLQVTVRLKLIPRSTGHKAGDILDEVPVQGTTESNTPGSI